MHIVQEVITMGTATTAYGHEFQREHIEFLLLVCNSRLSFCPCELRCTLQDAGDDDVKIPTMHPCLW